MAPHSLPHDQHRPGRRDRPFRSGGWRRGRLAPGDGPPASPAQKRAEPWRAHRLVERGGGGGGGEGGGDIGFGAAEWYADNKFDLLRTRCMAYFNVDRIAGQSVSSHSPHATAELADWTRHMADRLSGRETEPGPPPRDADGSFLGVGLPSVAFPPPPHSMEEDPDAIDGDAMARWTGFNANAFSTCAPIPRAV